MCQAGLFYLVTQQTSYIILESHWMDSLVGRLWTSVPHYLAAPGPQHRNGSRKSEDYPSVHTRHSSQSGLAYPTLCFIALTSLPNRVGNLQRDSCPVGDVLESMHCAEKS